MRIAFPERLRARLRRSRRFSALVAVLALAVVGLGGYSALGRAQPAVRQEVLSVTGVPEADGTPVKLDATLYLPAGSTPRPAVVLAHGFGGSKDDEAADALYLARHGYVALTYSARGFGRSGGLIHLDSPQYEVRDAERMVDLLATLPQVVKDGPGDPRVGFTGPSYGGALSLLVAAYDHRVDAIAPQITWNSLGASLFGQSASGGRGTAGPGVFKKAWAGDFFGSGSSTPGAAPGAPADPCGRFAPDICAAYRTTAAGDGTPAPGLLDLLAASSPAGVLNRVDAPTLLVQGEDDSLFGLDQADANARGIAAHGTPVKVAWYSGGHDAPGTSAETAQLRSLTLAWFDHYLKHQGPTPSTAFSFTKTGTDLSLESGTVSDSTLTAPGYPGLPGGAAPRSTPVRLNGPEQTVLAPAGGYPAATTSLPGLGGTLAQLGSGSPALGAALAGPPDQQAVFTSAPLAGTVHEVGAASVELHVGPATPGTGDATLFAKLYDLSPGGQAVLPEQLVAPIRLTGLTPSGTDVRVALPGVVHDFPAGHRLELVVSTTDQAYQLPQDPRGYRVALAGSSTVGVPLVAAASADGGSTDLLWTIAGIAAALVLGAVGAWVLRRRRPGGGIDLDPELADVPVAITGLGKAYGDGFRAVSDLGFTVGPGQVLGLLGPNGAGKTTTLRMLTGLIFPTSGEIRVFGHRIVPGAPVLSRVGAFIEGPGFLPHLSGRENLALAWAATGRPEADADFAAALEIAGLGKDLERKVRAYSQGMRQRLAVAQAMLGLPDLLILDEPTNGLDPPQIREMRESLRRYAATGRTVVVSSHLLAEVEQTCTHCVVMARGRLLAAGPVDELIGAASSVHIDVDQPARAVELLTGLPGVLAARTGSDGALVVDLDRIRPAVAVKVLVEAGLAVDRIAPRRRLEDVFLDLVHEG
ncbi:alpha/beta fold hydrolase [Streptacidiphilus sp. PB12-B1b]|uniref:alpha/beta fold hydrolase n=1 Tax=Streptacidiphilus sp. PB12-B1b TaxID=2705012 RepID=UPI0015FB9A62|nr:alpha/beta fold hydrolase [Streptacidiphilus sp. PB12-B1b]QMU77430.1 alpha/beta fold hydrolase [Streptacidiphilus sp. PB12-B1b]